MPDGVYMDEAPANAKRFVVVSVVSGFDHAGFGGRLFEDITYLVKAVGLSTVSPNVEEAARRIDQLIEDAPLTVDGYSWMAACRIERVRTTEVDDVDPSIRWYHRGGRYTVQFALQPAVVH
jgi:hypothetical protein